MLSALRTAEHLLITELYDVTAPETRHIMKAAVITNLVSVISGLAVALKHWL